MLATETMLRRNRRAARARGRPLFPTRLTEERVTSVHCTLKSVRRRGRHETMSTRSRAQTCLDVGTAQRSAFEHNIIPRSLSCLDPRAHEALRTNSTEPLRECRTLTVLPKVGCCCKAVSEMLRPGFCDFHVNSAGSSPVGKGAYGRTAGGIRDRRNRRYWNCNLQTTVRSADPRSGRLQYQLSA